MPDPGKVDVIAAGKDKPRETNLAPIHSSWVPLVAAIFFLSSLPAFAEDACNSGLDLGCFIIAGFFAIPLSVPSVLIVIAFAWAHWRRTHNKYETFLLISVGSFFGYFVQLIWFFFLFGTRIRHRPGEAWWLEHLTWLCVLTGMILIATLSAFLSRSKRSPPHVILSAGLVLGIIGFIANSLAHYALVQYDLSDYGHQIRIDRDLCLSIMDGCEFSGKSTEGNISCLPNLELAFAVIPIPSDLKFTYTNDLQRQEFGTIPHHGKVDTFIELSDPKKVLKITAHRYGGHSFGHTYVKKCLDYLVINH